ncbi:hypothetical protein XFF6970_300025 [Xanthomonas citri pv. fuscans]|nr:hypothetical protein XFF6970_300025 [Xanthomonas citri pv. fuscans]
MFDRHPGARRSGGGNQNRQHQHAHKSSHLWGSRIVPQLPAGDPARGGTRNSPIQRTDPPCLERGYPFECDVRRRARRPGVRTRTLLRS